MPIPQLKETAIRDRATAKVFQRGEQYYRSGVVTNIWSRGDILEATVEGSERQPYRVSIQFDNAEIERARCTCAYAFEGWCKHMVATALLYLRQPETLTERPSLEQLLDRLNPIQNPNSNSKTGRRATRLAR
ncbi:MAG: hypothetical protein HC834_06810 [Rhodospirillales bacterium]|nr:hypothetical protein [Rhodospirillales bacterium]